jgi:hypothetical protein|tara:strand:- start:61 stop:315 length:255 start_codon:yes stop_codon:yes gene_type:complete
LNPRDNNVKRYSTWSVFLNGLTGQKNWDRAWRDPEPKTEYDVIILQTKLPVWYWFFSVHLATTTFSDLSSGKVPDKLGTIDTHE